MLGLTLRSNSLLLSNMYRLTSTRLESSWSRYKDAVVTNSDGSVIVCWHPEQPFPYECSRPIPRSKAAETHGVLKVQKVKDMDELYKYKHPRLARRDLMRLTWTTKHRWFPTNKHKHEDMRKNPRERPFM